MTLTQNIQHRRAMVQRRAPAPQFGFDPFGFGKPKTTSTPKTSDDSDNGGFGATDPRLGGGDGDGSILTDAAGHIIATDDPFNTSKTRSSTTTSKTTSTTSTTSTTTSTTSSTTSTTPKPTQVVTTSTPIITKFATITSSASPTVSAASSQTSSASNSSSSISTGTVVGGIAAGIVAIIAIGAAIAFFVRRSRKRSDQFDSDMFRRSAVLLDDPPTHQDTVNRGFNPDPGMNEKQAPPASYGNQYDQAYGYQDPSMYDPRAGYGAGAPGYGGYQPSFMPGQIMMNMGQTPSPISATSAHPLYPGAQYNQSPFTPVSEAGYPGQFQQDPNFPQPAGGAAYPVLTRQSSGHSIPEQQQPNRMMTPPRPDSIPADDYLDLTRSSVSPFQATQYAAISEKLNSEIPGLPGSENAAPGGLPPPPPPKHDGPSPFADPAVGQNADLNRQPSTTQSAESIGEQALKFPAPPSPTHASVSRYRVDSTPPTLPEISVGSSSSVTPPPATAAAPATAKPPATGTNPENKRTTTYSLYDNDDAYGGF